MSKKDLEKALSERSPLSPRQAVQPVDFYPPAAAAEPVPAGKPEHTPAKENKANDRTVRTNGGSDRDMRPAIQSSLLTELTEGVDEERRRTERYSFEIFSDQKERIEELQYQFKRKTGNKLSSSRILREALEENLEKALKTLQ